MINNISDLKKLNNTNTWIIHYACNGLYDGLSSAHNISCIIVSNLNCENKRKFYVKDYLGEHSFKESEKLLLKKFADFINQNTDKYFVHWNMNSQSFGFNAINARCRKLEIEIKDIPNENKIDLSKIVEKLANKKLSLKQTLMFKDMLFDDFLNGKDELEAYNKGNYNALLESVHDKVIGIQMLIEVINENSFKSGFNNTMPKSKYTQTERKQLDKELKRYREEIFNNNKAVISKMQQDFEDYKNEVIDSYEEDLAEENNGGIFVFDTGHPLLSMFANLFLNR